MPTVKVRDIETYYEISGEGERLLFIHGLGSSTRDWEFQVNYFAPSYRVITLDMRGHGKSSKPAGPYRIAGFAEDTAELIRILDEQPIHIIGLSLGGAVAFQLALDAPELVKTLTIVNSAPDWTPRTLKDRLLLMQRLLIVRLVGMRKMGEVLAKRLLPSPEHADLRAIFIERWAENDKRAYLNSLHALVGWSVEDRLGEIACPTLVVAAEHDYRPLAEKEAYVGKMQQARLAVIPESRHATPVEYPEIFNQTLKEFVEAYR